MFLALLAVTTRPSAAQERNLAAAAAVAETPVAETPVAEKPAADAQAAPPAKDPAKPPDGFKLGDWTFKIGGRVLLDVIQDFNPIANEDSFDTRTIPIDGGDRKNSNLNAKETRLSLDIRGPAEGHELRMYIEGDFYGSGTTFRMRHAYGTWRWMLAGQTWSTFMDEDNIPRTIDFESPTAMAIVRQGQFRVTKTFGSFLWAVAVEDNKSNIIVPENVPGAAEFPFPDLATRFRWTRSNGHIQASAFTGAARFRPSGPNPDPTDRDRDLDPDTVPLWGTLLSINFTTVGRDTAYGMVTYGSGIGRYRGGLTAAPDFDDRLHPVTGIAVMAGYEHFWSPRWSTDAVYSTARADPEPFYTAQVNKQLDYAALNLLYWFLGPRGWMGIEYLWGKRVVFDAAPDSGTANRLQYAVRFNFP